VILLIGDREIVGIEVCDIKDHETPNRDKEYDCGDIRGGHMA